jgi:hypothetical protein
VGLEHRPKGRDLGDSVSQQGSADKSYSGDQMMMMMMMMLLLLMMMVMMTMMMMMMMMMRRRRTTTTRRHHIGRSLAFCHLFGRRWLEHRPSVGVEDDQIVDAVNARRDLDEAPRVLKAIVHTSVIKSETVSRLASSRLSFTPLWSSRKESVDVAIMLDDEYIS